MKSSLVGRLTKAFVMLAIFTDIANILSLSGWILLPNIAILLVEITMFGTLFFRHSLESKEQKLIELEKELWEKEKVIKQLTETTRYKKDLAFRN